MPHVLSYRAGSLRQPHLPLPRLAELGIGGLELSWSPDTTADAVRAVVEPAGLQVTSLQVAAALDDPAWPDTLGQQAAAAASMGAGYLFISVRAGEMDREEVYARLRRAGDAVGEHGVFLAMETHPDLCQNADNMLETMAAVDHPWVGINYDTANIHYYNEEIDSLVEAGRVAHHVRGVHLKETRGGFHDGDFPVFGQGIIDFAGIAAVLDAAGYTGALCMELEGPVFASGDPEGLADKIGQCIAHLRSVGLTA